MIRIAGPVWLEVTCDLWLYEYLQKINYTFVENVFKVGIIFFTSLLDRGLLVTK